jgi:DNA-binding transcriptional ArsR family regulator
MDIAGDKRLNPLDISVYVILDSFADRAGICYPGLITIAGRAQLSRPAVSASLSRLESAGYIERQIRRVPGKKGFDRTLYTLVFRHDRNLKNGAEAGNNVYRDSLKNNTEVVNDVTRVRKDIVTEDALLFTWETMTPAGCR